MIPVVDMSDAETRGTAAAAAARDTGFFHLVGHGVPPAEMDGILRATAAFFALPLAERTAISNLRSPHFRGYTAVGTEHTQGRPDVREQLDIAEEHPPAPPGPGEPGYRWLRGPNQWPAALPELRATALGWIARLRAVAATLLDDLVVALGAPRGCYADGFEPDPHVHLKLIRYPALDTSVTSGTGQGVGLHKDYGFLTLLLSDGVPGLRVVPDDGTEIEVDPRPGALVVNLGELLEIASGGRLVATRHRVVAGPRQRCSVAFFYNPRLDYRVRPLPGHENPDLTADPDNPIFDVYGDNAWKGWLRAHPAVASRHHPTWL